MDANETRTMITDIIGKPLAEVNGQLRLLVQQSANIEIQTRITNGRVSELEEWQLEVIKTLASGLPHHVEDCSQGPTLKEMKEDIGEIKKDVGALKIGKIVKGTIYTSLKSDITVILIGLGLILNLWLGIRNGKKNDTQIKNQDNLRNEIIENVVPTTRGGQYIAPIFKADTNTKK